MRDAPRMCSLGGVLTIASLLFSAGVLHPQNLSIISLTPLSVEVVGSRYPQAPCRAAALCDIPNKNKTRPGDCAHIDRLNIGAEMVVATRVPRAAAPVGNVNAFPDAPSVASLEGGQVGLPQACAKNNPRAVKDPESGKQTKRILYIIPNFRAVGADQQLPPQTVKEKFKTATLDSVDYSSFIFVAIQAGITQARNGTPEFHQGAAGYGRYYWHTYADYANENLWVEFIFPQLCTRIPVTTRSAVATFPSG
jgi:hypothetical protein